MFVRMNFLRLGEDFWLADTLRCLPIYYKACTVIEDFLLQDLNYGIAYLHLLEMPIP